MIGFEYLFYECFCALVEFDYLYFMINFTSYAIGMVTLKSSGTDLKFIIKYLVP